MSETSTQFDDQQFEAAAGGGLIEPDAELSDAGVELICVEIDHIREGADRLIHTLDGVFPPQDGVHGIPKRIHAELDGLEARLDAAAEEADATEA
ncbi:MAG: hypothetical protein QNJ12_20545 [Ilumatobacter sp.]|uniref:hypothetical protein n=1 Tax=Ilumatobacter sp. TaxID=1967498 RepID=UPI0026385B99|nr:hypothetical protein [Ilumatobacter sp.]MDJ0771189.1 hypothetical protein [Ilumatobacter sp.]